MEDKEAAGEWLREKLCEICEVQPELPDLIEKIEAIVATDAFLLIERDASDAYSLDSYRSCEREGDNEKTGSSSGRVDSGGSIELSSSSSGAYS